LLSLRVAQVVQQFLQETDRGAGIVRVGPAVSMLRAARCAVGSAKAS